MVILAAQVGHARLHNNPKYSGGIFLENFEKGARNFEFHFPVVCGLISHYW